MNTATSTIDPGLKHRFRRAAGLRCPGIGFGDAAPFGEAEARWFSAWRLLLADSQKGDYAVTMAEAARLTEPASRHTTGWLVIHNNVTHVETDPAVIAHAAVNARGVTRIIPIETPGATVTAKRTRIIERGNGHSYELDGKKVPGVTTILSNGIPKPALVGWAAKTVAEYVVDRLAVINGQVVADSLVNDLRTYNETRRYPETLRGDLPRVGLSKVLGTVQYAERDAAANRGTAVHKIAERLARGEEVPVPDELAGHVASYLRFLEEWQPTDAVLERVVVNRRWRYMGKFDMIATLPPPLGRTLLDIKTSRSGPFEETALQLAGYRFCGSMLEPDGTEVPMPEVDSCAVVWVRADGYDVYRFSAGEAEHRVFLYAKSVGDWMGSAREEGVKSEALDTPEFEAVDQ